LVFNNAERLRAAAFAHDCLDIDVAGNRLDFEHAREPELDFAIGGAFLLPQIAASQIITNGLCQ